ncbi:MAG: hypothetical protein ABS43_06505 [Bordetella sp. SCN 67-23]|nr:DUF2863 family protein [Burkholderiales bacterium]ODS75246.1 MAG: hypothetical protein ABS43_06505 [Bordetella sp. SCN 67-23]OJW93349.1 MAG: hypothetical protein BGO71_15270 [Burkholderiales bacterium 67-32]
MPRSRSTSSSRLNRDAEKLVSLSLSLNGSGSRVEDRYWEGELGTLLEKLMHGGQDATIEAALEVLYQRNAGAYEILVEQAETLSESLTLQKDGVDHDVLLVVAPVVAWTRFSIPYGPIRIGLLDALKAQLHGHILAADARVALAPELYSVDQMPRSFSATRLWLSRLGSQALGLTLPRMPATDTDTEVASLLADTRYVVAAVAVPRGAAVFRWQENPGKPEHTRESCLALWEAQAAPLFADLLPGCGFECLLPDAYYVNNREADRRVRPLSLRASVAWLEATLGIAPDQLRAVIAACGETEVEEYRIGFTQRQSNDVIYGSAWPMFGRDDDNPDMPAMDVIADQLRELGVTDLRKLQGLLPLEFCDDCGAPYFPNPLGEMVHAEPPEDADAGPAHFH